MGISHQYHRLDHLQGHHLVVSKNFQGVDVGHQAVASTGVPFAEDDRVLVPDEEAFLSSHHLASSEVPFVDNVAEAFPANDHEAH
jgi:hypothetical protein